MGAGLAKSLRSAYPIIFPRYQQFCRAGHLRPGMVQFVCVSDSLYVCNLAGQDGYGRDRCYTDYDADPFGTTGIIAYNINNNPVDKRAVRAKLSSRPIASGVGS
jgi:hypothetical protein